MSRDQQRTVAVVQARMGSTRLPGKLLLTLGDRSILQWVLDRVRRAQRLHAVVLATSTAAADDCLVEHCRRWDVPCFRGSEADVLGRFAATAECFDAGLIVRVNADNPLVDPQHIDALVEAALRSGADYQSYRRGDGKPVMLTALSFFTEVISRACLRRAHREIVDPFRREHVTLGIYGCPEQFDVRWLDVPACCNDPRLRFTVDTPSDFDLLQEVFQALGGRAATATPQDVVRLVQGRPEWLQAMTAGNALNPKRDRAALSPENTGRFGR